MRRSNPLFEGVALHSLRSARNDMVAKAKVLQELQSASGEELSALMPFV